MLLKRAIVESTPSAVEMALDYHLITFLVAFFVMVGIAMVFAIPLAVVVLIHLIKKEGVRA